MVLKISIQACYNRNNRSHLLQVRLKTKSYLKEKIHIMNHFRQHYKHSKTRKLNSLLKYECKKRPNSKWVMKQMPVE